MPERVCAQRRIRAVAGDLDGSACTPREQTQPSSDLSSR
jgi:hypothetical protein